VADFWGLDPVLFAVSPGLSLGDYLNRIVGAERRDYPRDGKRPPVYSGPTKPPNNGDMFQGTHPIVYVTIGGLAVLLLWAVWKRR